MPLDRRRVGREVVDTCRVPDWARVALDQMSNLDLGLGGCRRTQHAARSTEVWHGQRRRADHARAVLEGAVRPGHPAHGHFVGPVANRCLTLDVLGSVSPESQVVYTQKMALRKES